MWSVAGRRNHQAVGLVLIYLVLSGYALRNHDSLADDETQASFQHGEFDETMVHKGDSEKLGEEKKAAASWGGINKFQSRVKTFCEYPTRGRGFSVFRAHRALTPEASEHVADLLDEGVSMLDDTGTPDCEGSVASQLQLGFDKWLAKPKYQQLHCKFDLGDAMVDVEKGFTSTEEGQECLISEKLKQCKEGGPTDGSTLMAIGCSFVQKSVKVQEEDEDTAPDFSSEDAEADKLEKTLTSLLELSAYNHQNRSHELADVMTEVMTDDGGLIFVVVLCLIIFIPLIIYGWYEMRQKRKALENQPNYYEDDGKIDWDCCEARGKKPGGCLFSCKKGQTCTVEYAIGCSPPSNARQQYKRPCPTCPATFKKKCHVCRR